SFLLVVNVVIPSVNGNPGTTKNGSNGPNGTPGIVSVNPSSPASRPATPMLHTTLSVAGITTLDGNACNSFTSISRMPAASTPYVPTRLKLKRRPAFHPPAPKMVLGTAEALSK